MPLAGIKNMVSKVAKKLQTTIIGGAITISFFTIIAKLLALVRNQLLAFEYGAGNITDAYYAAFRLPDLVSNTLFVGALSVAFIPVFVEFIAQGEKVLQKGDHWKIANALLNTLLVIIIAVIVVLGVFAPSIIPHLVPGFDEQTLATTVSLTRLMLVGVFFLALSSVFSGILQSYRRFHLFALAPVLYNVGLIIGIVLAPRFGISMLGIGVILGAALHMLIQAYDVFRIGYRYQLVIDFANIHVKKIIFLMIPRMLGMIGNQLNQVVNTIIASTLITGSVAVYYWAFDLQSAPYGIIAIPYAIAAFPVFAQAFAKNKNEEFVSHFSTILRRILYIIIPASILILILRAQLVRLILGYGQFDWEDTVMTIRTLSLFIVSLFAQGIIPLLARSFYARHNTKTPVVVSLISIVINIIGSIILAPRLGVAGLALSFSIASIFNASALWLLLRLEIGDLDDEKILRNVSKISIGAIISGWLAYGTLYLAAGMVDTQTVLGLFTQGTVATLVFGAVYIAYSWIANVEEFAVVKKLFNK
ncbi:MAG: murein biosynthesis integral membrane protein MurJ [Candidatus Jacksonbacteria bacterium]|jgi:putative peptidoglycan lipid II flippase|nr:murein biosynthesis integral membrane protein MurJ [Candidatus Jacksonbacteria bacterium]